ncbi:MAG: sodium:solute symporter [Prevotellaceae bacterium]|nr:sodium:solute symporter [Prevotellaceae bacterium]
MSPLATVGIVCGYFAVLVLISWLTTRRVQADSFYLGNRRSPWYVIAFGMVGSSTSGVTFVSVPGMVAVSQFSYIQMALGFVVGYVVVAQVLLPLYYGLGLTSIYAYLGQRFGKASYKTGAAFFLLSRLLGSAIRLLVVAVVLQSLVFDKLGVPFAANVVLTIVLIFLYTHKGGIKTIIWTDTLQTLALLLTLVLCIVGLAKSMGMGLGGVYELVRDSEFSRTFFFDDPNDKRYFWKQFLAGIFTTITMTGLDQDLMQKNLSCKNIREAQRNMRTYGLAFLPVILLFLSLGAMLYAFAARNAIALPASPDELFPLIATGGFLSPVVGVLFVVGIIAAAYSSADSALTALTTSFTIDILGIPSTDPLLRRKRRWVHLSMCVAFLALIIAFRRFYSQSIINTVYDVAGLTYGPLLGMFAFGLFTRMKVRDGYVPLVAVLSPLLAFALKHYSPLLFGGYQIGFELLIINGAITFLGMVLLRKK